MGPGSASHNPNLRCLWAGVRGPACRSPWPTTSHLFRGLSGRCLPSTGAWTACLDAKGAAAWPHVTEGSGCGARPPVGRLTPPNLHATVILFQNVEGEILAAWAVMVPANRHSWPGWLLPLSQLNAKAGLGEWREKLTAPGVDDGLFDQRPI